MIYCVWAVASADVVYCYNLGDSTLIRKSTAIKWLQLQLSVQHSTQVSFYNKTAATIRESCEKQVINKS